MDRALQPLPVSLFVLKGTNVVRQHGLGTDVASPQSEEVSSRVLAGSSSSIAASGFFFLHSFLNSGARSGKSNVRWASA